MPPIGRLADMRTSLSERVHSLPPTHRPPYLERHLLAKKRERLAGEIARLERRCQQCRRQLADIEAKMGHLAAPGEVGRAAATPLASREQAPGRFSKMSVEY